MGAPIGSRVKAYRHGQLGDSETALKTALSEAEQQVGPRHLIISLENLGEFYDKRPIFIGPRARRRLTGRGRPVDGLGCGGRRYAASPFASRRRHTWSNDIASVGDVSAVLVKAGEHNYVVRAVPGWPRLRGTVAVREPRGTWERARSWPGLDRGRGIGS